MLNEMLRLCERLGEADLFSTFKLHNSLDAQVEGGRGHRLGSEARKRPYQYPQEAITERYVPAYQLRRRIHYRSL